MFGDATNSTAIAGDDADDGGDNVAASVDGDDDGDGDDGVRFDAYDGDDDADADAFRMDAAQWHHGIANSWVANVLRTMSNYCWRPAKRNVVAIRRMHTMTIDWRPVTMETY